MLTEDGPRKDNSTTAEHTLDLTPYIGHDTADYIRVTDASPADGWGGGVYHVSADYGTD